MSLQGKGWFIWQIPRCEGGNANLIAERAAQTGCTHVLIKVAERTYGFGFDSAGRDLVPAVADALRARGIQVWGWHYVYGDNPTGEANIAVQRCQKLRLDGYIIDAEAEYKRPNMATPARTFMNIVRPALPNTLIALSSYRYPSYHQQLPWKAFLEQCDLTMPQVYWEQAHNPEPQLERTLKEYKDTKLVGVVRPLVPTGSAYGVNNWKATADDITKFYAKAVSLGLAAANLYSWDYARSAGNTFLWDAAAAFQWPGAGAQPQDIVERLFAALNSGDPNQVSAAYQFNAAHVTAQRTIVGQEALRQWYTDLLKVKLPGAQFTVQDAVISGNFRQVLWTAAAPAGLITDGEDSLGLVDGLIQYHTTSFTITPRR
jgi:hypothetical protein